MTTGPITTLRSPEAQHYLDGVAVALADLPDDDRADLLDELAAHVDELVAESDVPLADRLGSPADYAAELRAAAGLPPARARGRAGSRLVTRVRALGERRQVAAARSFLGSLRPVWWVVRAWVLVGAVTWPIRSTDTWSGNLPFVPRLGTPEVGLVVLALAVWASVQLGRGAVAAPRRAMLAVNAVAAVLALPVLVSCTDQANNVVYIQEGAVYVDGGAGIPPEGVYAGGDQVWNIYAYDAQGNLLHDVRLYDEDGAPLTLGLASDVTRKPVVDGKGRLIENVYPYRYVEPDGTVRDPDAGPTVDAPPLIGVPSASVSPSPTPSGSPSPGAASTGGKR
jgi:hypothetical protein